MEKPWSELDFIGGLAAAQPKTPFQLLMELNMLRSGVRCGTPKTRENPRVMRPAEARGTSGESWWRNEGVDKRERQREPKITEKD